LAYVKAVVRNEVVGLYSREHGKYLYRHLGGVLEKEVPEIQKFFAFF
jgi:hypothetical protein